MQYTQNSGTSINSKWSVPQEKCKKIVFLRTGATPNKIFMSIFLEELSKTLSYRIDSVFVVKKGETRIKQIWKPHEIQLFNNRLIRNRIRYTMTRN